ncbi:MAG: hypothetical protein VW362_07945, partial [Candidatus Nanopelagicales bacterium]
INALVDNVVGCGFRPKLTLDYKRLGISKDKADDLSTIAGELWQEWGEEVRDLGWRWSAADTPRQASNRLVQQMPLGEDERAALRRLVWWVEQVRYAAPEQIVAPAPAELRQDLATLRKAAWGSLIGGGEQIEQAPQRETAGV